MPCCERHELIAPISKQRIGANKQRARSLSNGGCYRCIEIMFGTSIHHLDLLPDCVGGGLQVSQSRICVQTSRIDKERNYCGCRDQFAQKLQLLRF